ncbi:MAG: sensor histidine kinase RegB [Shimia sp.]
MQDAPAPSAPQTPPAPHAPTPDFAAPIRRWIRLRTLVVLRWIAVTGQLVAITLADRVFGVELPLLACYAVIGGSVLANIVLIAAYPENRRLSAPEATSMLLFDVLQLGMLLALTGGLDNPFALLILAPVTIAATALPSAHALALGAVATIVVTAIALWSLPLRGGDGFALQLPEVFVFGYWVGIVVGIAFIAFYARRITREITTLGQALAATQMALAREQKLTDLGGVVAAAAHELGTPLATIKLVSAELMDDLPEGAHREDAALIREQADRCRDILRGMGRAGKDDLHMRFAPIETVLGDAAEPHADRGKRVTIRLAPEGEPATQPQIRRRPEIIHGLRNLIQNAVDFATSEVDIEIGWNSDEIRVDITDDGPGFPPQMAGRIGDPFLRFRRGARAPVPDAIPGAVDPISARPGYDGMGLGLFIAKTLLERSGARLAFGNGTGMLGATGAHVRVTWPARALTEGADARGANPLQSDPLRSEQR